MNMARFLKAMLAVSVVAACACALAACSSGNNASGNAGGNANGGAVAATVNGVEIPEAEITESIQGLRDQYGMSEEDAWGEYLVMVGQTPEDIRNDLVDSRIDQELVKANLGDLGLTIEDSEIDEYITEFRTTNQIDDDEKWHNMLDKAGFTEDSYRDTIKNSYELAYKKVQEHFENEVKVEDDDLFKQADEFVSSWGKDTAKRSSHILIKTTDDEGSEIMDVEEAREKAQGIVDRIRNGEISFEDAAKESSEDQGSAENGGDVGWDVLSSFVNEYTEALDGLEKGDISDPVESQYGVHIIMVTDTFQAPKKVKSLDDWPEELRTKIEEDAKESKVQSDFDAWLKGLRDKADIQKNDMPADAPYNIDLTKYQKDDSEEAVEVTEGADDTNSEDDIEVEVEDASADSASSEAAASDEAASSEAASSESADEAA